VPIKEQRHLTMESLSSEKRALLLQRLRKGATAKSS